MDYTLCPENCQHFHPVRKIASLKDCKIRIDDNDDNVIRREVAKWHELNFELILHLSYPSNLAP